MGAPNFLSRAPSNLVTYLELTQNFSNYNDSISESCQDSSFREAHVRANCCLFLNNTTLIISPFPSSFV